MIPGSGIAKWAVIIIAVLLFLIPPVREPVFDAVDAVLDPVYGTVGSWFESIYDKV